MFTKKNVLELYAKCRVLSPDFTSGETFQAAFTHWCNTVHVCPPDMPRALFESLRSAYDEILERQAIVLSEPDDDISGELPLFPEGFWGVPKPDGRSAFTFIDLFAGIGGFHVAMEAVGGHCVFASEWDRYAQTTYWTNFGIMPYGDIRKIDATAIPSHDVLCAGFPCQPFSLAGVSKKNSLGRKHGFEDKTQGTLFFDVCRIIAAKRPKAFFLENVKNLLSHDGGKTFRVIRDALDELGYTWTYKIVDGAAWVPQHRERIFIVGFDKTLFPNLKTGDIVIPTAPAEGGRKKRLADIILKDNPDASRYTLGDGTWATLKRHKMHHEQAGNGFGYGLHTFPFRDDEVTRTISARYHKDGAEILIDQPGRNPRRLTVEEAMQLQGYDPKTYRFPVSRTQAYHQIGNSVVVPAVTETAGMIAKILLGGKE